MRLPRCFLHSGAEKKPFRFQVHCLVRAVPLDFFLVRCTTTTAQLQSRRLFFPLLSSLPDMLQASNRSLSIVYFRFLSSGLPSHSDSKLHSCMHHPFYSPHLERSGGKKKGKRFGNCAVANVDGFGRDRDDRSFGSMCTRSFSAHAKRLNIQAQGYAHSVYYFFVEKR